jgi:4-amino-4-deoxy-L-arabinose transferase-like glycosyltransferase
MSASIQAKSAGASMRHVSTLRQFIVLLFLAGGVHFWILLGRAQLGERRQLIAAVLAVILAIVVWAVHPLRRIVAGVSNGIAHSSTPGRLITAIAIAILSTAYLYATARYQHRDFSPILHDEYSYLIQAKMLSSGHFWLPKHELSDFFDSFHIITDRAYASKYGPGTALFYAPAMLLHWPTWMMPLLLSGVAVGLMYLLVTELFDGGAGWLAALMLLSLGIFRRTSIMTMSQAPMLALALIAMLAFVYWRRNRSNAWMILLGIAVGWGAITRPVDAICVALPIAIVVLTDLRKVDNRQRIKAIAAGMIAAAPFLVLQLIYDKGVTGHFTTLPWNYYAQRYDPYDSLSRKPIDPDFRPMSALLQKQQFYDEFTLQFYRKKLSQSRVQGVVDRATRTLTGPPLEEEGDKNRLIYGALPSPLLVALLPVGLLGLCGCRRWVWLGLPCFVLLYASYTFFLPHYAVAIVPAVMINLLAGRANIARTWPWPPVSWAVTFTLAAMSLTALPQLNPVRRDQWFDAPTLRNVDSELAGIKGPAIVLFKFDPDRPLHEEPVYNIEAAWPDDARVIRAHDLGDANVKLFAYYAEHSPDRAVYRYDEKDGVLTYLGTAAEMHLRPATRPSATRP